MSSIVVFAIVVMGCVGLAFTVDRLARRHRSPTSRSETGPLLGALVSVYGILVSLVVVAAWNDYRVSRDLSEEEVSDAVDLYYSLSHMPPPLSTAGTRDVIAYLDSLVAYEWPAMAEEKLSKETSAVVQRLWERVATYEPKSKRYEQLQRFALTQLGDLDTRRRLRLASAARGLPVELWAIVILGGVLAIGISSLFGVESRRALMVRLATAAMLGLIVSSIYAFEAPFKRPAQLPVADIAGVRDLLMTDWNAEHTTAEQR